MRRREVLTTVAAGATGALAGCSRCGETWYAHQLSFELDEIARVESGWNLTVSASANFDFPTSDDQGIGPFDIALYGADKSLLDYATVDGLRWGDVPEDERIETECGDGGSASATRSFSVAELPHCVGPRFVDGRVAASFDSNSSSGFSGITAIRYAAAGERSATVTGGTDEPNEGVSPDAFEPVRVETLPWPTPDNQAVRETESLTNARFRTAPACTSRGGVQVRTGFFRADLLVEWARSVPDGSCERPFLESLSLENGRLSMGVGLHDAPHVRCRDCTFLGYRLLVDRREDVEITFDEVEVLHLSEQGNVVERIIQPVED